MDKSDSSSPKNTLSFSVLSAVAEAIEKHIGKPVSISERKEGELQPVKPNVIAVTVAYTNLLLDKSQTVTSHHIKMMHTYSTIEQTQALTQFITEKALLEE